MLFWLAMALVYLLIGTLIGHISYHVWITHTHRFSDGKLAINFKRSPISLIFFPGSHLLGMIDSYGPIQMLEPYIHDRDLKYVYVFFLAFLWPSKVVNNTATLLAIAIGKSAILLLSFFKLLYNTTLKLIRRRVPSKSNAIEQRPGEVLDALKRELFTLDLQCEKLQDERIELTKKIQCLENEQAAEEGLTVYRADRSLNAKWHSSL